jgi:hypothetical protein
LTVFEARNRKERGKFLGTFCKEANVFEHVLDFLIDAGELALVDLFRDTNNLHFGVIR